MQINVIGSYWGCDGFSNHTRQLALAIDRIEGVDISMTTQRPQGWEGTVTDQELQIMLRDPEKANINLMIAQPQQWRLYSNENKPFIGFLVFEGDKIPEYWIEYLMDENVKQIWVPSKHVEDAIYNGLPKELVEIDKEGMEYAKMLDKIKIVPHGVDLSIFKPTETKKEKFKFLSNKGFRTKLDRGGVQDLIRAYIEEFTEEDNVELVLKINPAYGVYDVNKIIEEFKPKDKKSFAPILVNADALPFDKLVDVYNSADVYVSASKAEAFNLPVLEAMACGLPVITNDFGGQTDFVNDENGWLLKDGKLKEVYHELEYEGISWKDVDIKELRKAMRYVYEHKEDLKSKSIKSVEISKQYTWTSSAEKAYANLSELK